MVPASSLKVPRASSYSGSRSSPFPFAYTTLTSYGRSFQYRSARIGSTLCGPKPHGARTMVWALPRSLAATCGIILIFSSSGYLDVSVHRVPSVWLWIHHTVTGSASRVPPFRHPRITACLRLPVAFRSLSRLSSALSAKASTLRPFLLNLRSAALEISLHAAWFSRRIPLMAIQEENAVHTGSARRPVLRCFTHLLLAIVTIFLVIDFYPIITYLMITTSLS